MMLTRPRKCAGEGDVKRRATIRSMWDSAETCALLHEMEVFPLMPDSEGEEEEGVLVYLESEESDRQTTMTSPDQLPPALHPPPAPRASHVMMGCCGAGDGRHVGQKVSPGFTPSPDAPAGRTPSPDAQGSQGSSPGDFLLHRRHLEWNNTGANNEWNHLSDEMILAVFRWLPKSTLTKCARVCKRWNRLAFDETLWRRMDLANKTLKPGVVGRVLDRGAAVLRLTRSEIKTPLYTDVNLALSPRVSRVRYLDLSMASCTLEALEQLMSTCYRLRKLSLENCHLNDNICRFIGQNSALEVLNLCMSKGLTENGLVPICNNLHRLESLNVAWAEMSLGAVVYMVTSLPSSIHKLNLSGCRENLQDEDVTQLVGTCSNLKELDLSDSTRLGGNSVHSIVAGLPGLEYMALSRCYQIPPAELVLFHEIPTLLALDVFGMLRECALQQLRLSLPSVEINKFLFSSIARPTTGVRRTSMWGLRVRDNAV